MEFSLGYLAGYMMSVHFPLSVLISLAFAYIYGSVRSKGTNDLDFSRLDNWMFIGSYFLAMMVLTNVFYLLSSEVLSYPTMLYYSLIPGFVIGYITSEYMSAGSKYIALDRLDSLAWFATWSVLASALVYLVMFGIRYGIELV